MVRWADVEDQAAELAVLGRERFERFRFVLVGSIRRDGTPRISPTEVHIVDGELVLAMIPASLKVRDLLRDGRILLHSPVVDAAAPAQELKLRGLVRPIEDEAARRRVCDAIAQASGWRPGDDWRLFRVDVHSVAFVAGAWPEMTVTTWSPGTGLSRRRVPG